MFKNITIPWAISQMFNPHTQMFIPQVKNIEAQAKMLKQQVTND
jgi:hypothetical protein